MLNDPFLSTRSKLTDFSALGGTMPRSKLLIYNNKTFKLIGSMSKRKLFSYPNKSSLKCEYLAGRT